MQTQQTHPRHPKPRRRRKRRFSLEQEVYLHALAAHRLAEDERKEQLAAANLPPLGPLSTDDDLVAWSEAETRIDTQSGYAASFNALLAAEGQLLAWARVRLAKSPEYQTLPGKTRRELADLFGCRLPSAKRKLVDICMRLLPAA